MKYLEVLYEPNSGKIVSFKIHGKMDTLPSEGQEIKIIPYVEGMLKGVTTKLFNGTELVKNLNYITPLSIEEQIDACLTLNDIKNFLKYQFTQSMSN